MAGQWFQHVSIFNPSQDMLVVKDHRSNSAWKILKIYLKPHTRFGFFSIIWNFKQFGCVQMCCFRQLGWSLPRFRRFVWHHSDHSQPCAKRFNILKSASHPRVHQPIGPSKCHASDEVVLLRGVQIHRSHCQSTSPWHQKRSAPWYTQPIPAIVHQSSNKLHHHYGIHWRQINH